MTRDSCREDSHITTKPAFWRGSQLDSSRGDKIYAPASSLVITRAQKIVKLTFVDANNIAKRHAGINFDLL